MARFELVLSLAKRNDDNELYTEETEYVCFCKNLKDLEEITDTANEVIKEEIGESEEGEVRVFSSLARARMAKPHRTVHASTNPE